MTVTSIAVAAARVVIPPGARIPLGDPPAWLLAADEAGWQCRCTTPGKGRAKETCGRSHWDEQDRRCQHSGAGGCAMRLVLAPDASGATVLLCEPCAAGHARTATRIQAAQPAPTPGGLGQTSLLDLLDGPDGSTR